MADESLPAAIPVSPAPPAAPLTPFHIGDEFGTAKRNLPPAGTVLVCLAAVALIVGLVAIRGRAKPQAAGSVTSVASVPVPGQNLTLVALTFTLKNTTSRPLWVHTLTARLTLADGSTLDDEAASAVDLDRYFEAFPALHRNSEPPLSPEAKLLPGSERRGTIVVGFKVPQPIFEQRKSLVITIQPYDEPIPVLLQ
jgi:hypothetical protein